MISLRLTIRKTRLRMPQLLCLVLLLLVGVCFFITLFTISLRYEETAEQYFADSAYADVTFYGMFDGTAFERLEKLPGVQLAAGRTVRDFRVGERMYRAVSLTDGINRPHLYEGRLPKNSAECAVLRRSAEAMGLHIGDTVTLDGTELLITGFVASPEYIYMVQNARTMMAPPDRFAVLYVTQAFFPDGSNELIALYSDGFSLEEAEKAVGAFSAVLREDQINHILYRNDLEEITTFANIFPVIFAVLIAAVVYVMLSRTIQKDRKQIGTMKALGMPDGKIIRIYLLQFGFVSLAGGLLGGLLSLLLGDSIIGVFSSMFEVPALHFVVYPALWAVAVAAVIALCVLSGNLSLVGILPLLPAHAMRPRMPKGGKRMALERSKGIWKRLSWGTRYALKSAMRNKGRFFAVVLGMCGSCALLVFSLGFYDSIGNTQQAYFNGFANYDMIISFDPMPLELPHAALSEVDTGFKALVSPVEIRDEKYTLAVVEEGFDMVNIPAEKLQAGIILPAYYAEQWGVGVGDSLEMDGCTAAISAITPQHLGLTIYTGYAYMKTVMDELPPVYNTVYVRTKEPEAVTAFLSDSNIDFATVDDDGKSFDSIMESMSVLIWFLIGCSVVLGFAVLYAVGLINLSAREYEYMFMGVMGFPHKGIMAAHRKETLFQLVLSIPLGLLVGNLLLYSIKDAFSGNNFVISAAIFPQSYILSVLTVVGVTMVMAAVTSLHIGRLDIVEGLKAQEE